jgi:hypothetical protein
MTAPDILLAQAAVSAVVTMASPPVPVTTLTSQANPGDTQLRGASFAGFPAEGLIGFADDAGEDLIEIANPTSTTVDLVTEGMGQTGLLYTHVAGTTVYTNIVDESLLDPSPCRRAGAAYGSSRLPTRCAWSRPWAN